MNKGTVGPRYFAAANSGNGFVSLFDGIFAGLDRLYIIKGGSGTGKSRMMSDIAAKAEERGLYVERYYCSADADSLDGITVPGIRFGMLDGTAPHTRDPKYPGAVDEIVNVGAFWDAGALRCRVCEIKDHADAKAEEFRRAFGALSAALAADRMARDLIGQAVLREKTERTAERIIKKLPRGSGRGLDTRILDAFTMRGRRGFNTFAEIAGTAYSVTGRRGAASAFLSALCSAALDAGHHVVRALDPLNTEEVTALYLPDAGAAFVRDPGGRETERTVNTDRFIDPAVYRENRSFIVKFIRQRNEMTDAALDFLARAAEHHFALETIYSSAMDFEAKERLTAELTEKVFK